MNKWPVGFIVNCALVPLAWSQCAPGIPSAGNPGCIPPDQPNSPYYQGDVAQPQVATQPAAVWADRWGAIAIDSNTGQSGFIGGRTSKEEAADIAMKGCAMNGSPDCKLELTYHNQCVAVAWGTYSHVVSNAPYVDAAKSNAMRSCSQRTQDCKVVYSECSYAVRVR